jgi:glutathione S-transferase
MRLIGMLDSPFVRRVAISLDVLGVPFQHEAVSVFSTFEKFQSLNPVVKAPTLLCDDGTVLMDSSLILQFVEARFPRSRQLWSDDPRLLQQQFSMLGLALAGCEKSVQAVYETNLRPLDKQHDPWLQRVRGQLVAAYAGLERSLHDARALPTAGFSHPTITAAVAWQFTQSMLKDWVPEHSHPQLASLARQLEQTSPFRKYPPLGPGINPPR